MTRDAITQWMLADISVASILLLELNMAGSQGLLEPDTATKETFLWVYLQF
jgi:hypothetical protein